MGQENLLKNHGCDFMDAKGNCYCGPRDIDKSDARRQIAKAMGQEIRNGMLTVFIVVTRTLGSLSFNWYMNRDESNRVVDEFEYGTEVIWDSITVPENFTPDQIYRRVLSYMDDEFKTTNRLALPMPIDVPNEDDWGTWIMTLKDGTKVKCITFTTPVSLLHDHGQQTTNFRLEVRPHDPNPYSVYACDTFDMKIMEDVTWAFDDKALALVNATKVPSLQEAWDKRQGEDEDEGEED